MSRRSPLLLVLCLCLVAVACGEKDRKLKVTGLEPNRGDIDGGTYVVIKGNRFIADGPRTAKVYFGTKEGGFRAGEHRPLRERRSARRAGSRRQAG